MIIGLVGEKLAGKDTASSYLSVKYGASHFRFTHILDSILEELDLPISRVNEIDLGLGLRKIFGEHVLVNALQNRIRKSLSGFQVVNGIRMDEMDVVKSWGAQIIYITAPSELRFERYKQRHEKTDDALLNFEDFKKQDLSITEAAIPELGKKADFRIDNTGSVEDLHQKLDKVIELLKNKRG